MLSSDKVKSNRELSGKYLRDLRKNHKSKMNQRELADTIGITHYTFISQLENGHATIPPALWVPLALALDVEPSIFVCKMLYWNEADIYRALFEHKPAEEVAELLRKNFKV